MHQITIVGSTARIKLILDFIERLDRIEKSSTREALEDAIAHVESGKKIAENTLTPTGFKISDNIPAKEPAAPVDPAPAETTGRKRRTKAEIEADNAKAAGAVSPAAEVVKAANSFTFDELKGFVQEKAVDENNAEKIRGKLAEFGVKKTRDLPEQHWNALWVFLQAL